MNLKPFDLQAALAGAKVVTRDGLEVTQVTHFQGVSDNTYYPVYAVVDNTPEAFTESGVYKRGEESPLDLFMAPTTRKLWVNVYRNTEGAISLGRSFDDYDEALDTASHARSCSLTHVATVPIEFEE